VTDTLPSSNGFKHRGAGDLTVFKESTQPQNQTAKKGRKTGGSLAKMSHASGSLSQINTPEALQNIEIVNKTLGSNFTPQLLARLAEVAANWQKEYDEAQQLEEALVLAAHERDQQAKAMGKIKANLKIKLKELNELKKEAESWIENDFEIFLSNLAKINIPFELIQQHAIAEAAKFHLELVGFVIKGDGSWDEFDVTFIHDEQIKSCEAELKKFI
jgi:hypothetical protein